MQAAAYMIVDVYFKYIPKVLVITLSYANLTFSSTSSARVNDKPLFAASCLTTRVMGLVQTGTINIL